MKKNVLMFLGAIVFFIGSLIDAQAFPMWEVKVGLVRTAAGSDSRGNTWTSVATVIGTITIGSNEYFQIDQFNYQNSGKHTQMLMRVTDDKVWVSDGTTENILFQIAPIGTTWTFFDEKHELISKEEITIPYSGGATQEGYVYRHSKIGGDRFWYEYLIPGLGLIQEIDWATDNAPKVEQLFSITLAPDPTASLKDFNADGKMDILLRNTVTGENHVWLMNGVSKISAESLQILADTNWTIAGVGDFNADRKPDIIWRNKATGQNAVWYMNRVTRTSAEYLETIADLDWAITGVGDFNRDGMPDILWSNTATGQNRIWYMMGATKSSSEDLPSVADKNWAMVGVGDFNSDGMPDILWSHRSSGQNYVWYMDGAKRIGGEYLPAVFNLNWEVVGIQDFNADGHADILWRNKSTGENYLWYMNGATKTGGEFLETLSDTNWKIVNH